MAPVKRSKKPRTLASMPRFHIVRVGDKVLFAPSEEQWGLHEASKPTAVRARAGISDDVWDQWDLGEDFPKLLDCLYTARSKPADFGLGDFELTSDMVAFRDEATIAACLRAAPRPAKEMESPRRHNLNETISDAVVWGWLQEVEEEFPWVRSWLLRGEDPTSNVKVLTAGEVKRCSASWNFAAFCHEIQRRHEEANGKEKASRPRNDTT
jgi:hypothetical protein